MKPLLLLTALILNASAGDPAVPTMPIPPAEEPFPDWDFTAALYAPLMGLEGNVGLKGSGPFEADVSFDKIFDHLDGALSGAFQANHGRWSVTADTIWLKLSATGHPLAGSLFTVSQEQLTSSLSLGYEIYGSEDTRLEVAAGAALNSLDLDLELLTPKLPVTRRTTSGSQIWVDPFIGLRFQQRLGDLWSFFANGTVGGFGVSSDEYWQVSAGLSCRISEHTSLALAYRAISVDYQHGGFIYDTVTSGPNLGLVFKF